MFSNIQEALRAVENLCAQEGVQGNRATLETIGFINAHAYTSTQIKNSYKLLVRADDQFIKSTLAYRDYSEIERQIKEYAELAITYGLYSTRDLGNLHKILALIKGFVNGPTRGVESAETMISIPELLLRCWFLAKKYAIADTTDLDKSRLTQILMCLDGNIADQGSCMPGVVARLYPAYARFLQEDLALECSRQTARVRLPGFKRF